MTEKQQDLLERLVEALEFNTALKALESIDFNINLEPESEIYHNLHKLKCKYVRDFLETKEPLHATKHH